MKWRGLHRIGQGKVMVEAGQRCLRVTEEEYLRLKLSPALDELQRVGQGAGPSEKFASPGKGGQSAGA